MTDDTVNGVVTLAIGNLVVLLLAISIRQQRRSRGVSVPSLAAAIAVTLFHAAVQTIAISIASNFFASVQSLVGFAVLFALFPSAWCLLLAYDWIAFRRADAVEIETDTSDVLDMETGRRYVVWGEYDNAKRAYLAYAEAHPNSAEPLFGLEGMYLSQGRFQDAAATCRQIMEKFEHDILIWTKAAGRLAELLETSLRRPHEAAEIRSHLTRRNPAHARHVQSASSSPVDDATLKERLQDARKLAQDGSTDTAIAMLSGLRQTNPRDPRPLFDLAVILESSQQTEGARRTLDTIVRDFSGSPGVWADASIKLADLYLNRYGNEGAARELLEGVVEKSPLPDDRNAAQARLAKLNHPWA